MLTFYTKESITSGNDYNKGKQQEYLHSFAKKYLDVDIESITSTPLCLRQDKSPFGFIKKDEWNQAAGRYYTFFVTPPLQMVETHAMIVEKKKHFDPKQLGYSLNLDVTATQQKNYEENMKKAKEAVEKKRKENPSPQHPIIKPFKKKNKKTL